MFTIEKRKQIETYPVTNNSCRYAIICLDTKKPTMAFKMAIVGFSNYNNKIIYVHDIFQ